MTTKVISEASERVELAKDAIKQKEVIRVGIRQSKSSAGKYLVFQLAVELTKNRWGVKFSTIELEQVEHSWMKKFGILKAGVEAHDVDRNDGYCFTCGVFHSGDSFDVVRIIQTKRFDEKTKRAIPCKNTHLEFDGFCTVCGRNHEGHERIAKGDEKVIAATVRGEKKSPYADLGGVEHSELRINTRLWQMGNIAQVDSRFDDE